MSPHLARLVSFYGELRPERLAQLAHIYREDARFRDPFNDVCGLEAIESIFRHMFASLETPRFEVLESYENDRNAALLWAFRFRFKGQRRMRRIEGMSRLEFAADGRVACHHDHWDAAGQFYELLPLIGASLRCLRRRFAP